MRPEPSESKTKSNSKTIHRRGRNERRGAQNQQILESRWMQELYGKNNVVDPSATPFDKFRAGAKIETQNLFSRE